MDVLALLLVTFFSGGLLLAQSRRGGLAQLRAGAGSSRPPSHPVAHRRAFGQLGLDAEPPTPYRHQLSLSLSPSLASILIADGECRFLDVASNMVKLGTCQRTATDTIEELSRVNEELSDEVCVIGTGEPPSHCSP